MKDLDLTSRVLYRDSLIIVLNKPQGIPVHSGPRREGESMEDYFHQLIFDYSHPPHLAHRLDRDTSGCLILGRNKKALQKMGKIFENKRIKKTYWAIVHGAPKEDKGLIETWMKKVKMPKGWYMKNTAESPDAKHAVTAWKVMKRGKDKTWLELSPRTGRTHQIRVHCSNSLGCPIVGDWTYGRPTPEGEELPPLQLHARAIKVPLHHDAPPIYVEAPAPDVFENFEEQT